MAKKEKVGIYPGTFDPITNGHCDILLRAAGILDRLVIGISAGYCKLPMFSLEERMSMVEDYIKEYSLEDKIQVSSFNGLLVDFADQVGATVIVRGLRAISDFEYEFQMYCANSTLRPSIDTLFLPASEKNQFISSGLVKEIAGLGGDISSFTIPSVEKKLREYYGKTRTPVTK